jgi:hypothetical protein
MLSKEMAKFPGAVATKPVSIATTAFTRAIKRKQCVLKAQTDTEGIPNRFDEALRLIRTALDSKVIKNAA